MITDETILDITENITSPSCFGMTGSAEIIINSGGQAPFIIEWTDGVTTFSRTNIPTNTPFGYIITDADNCSTIRSLTITTPEQIQVNFVSDSVSCYGGHDGSLDISNSWRCSSIFLPMVCCWWNWKSNNRSSCWYIFCYNFRR